MKTWEKVGIGATVVAAGYVVWKAFQVQGNNATLTLAQGVGFPMTGSPGTVYLQGGYQGTYGPTGVLVALVPAPTGS